MKSTRNQVTKIKQLGEGGQGIAFSATYPGFTGELAAKYLKQQALENPKVLHDGLKMGWREGCRESRRCSRYTYPESYITKYTSIRRVLPGLQ